jgi:hypothetical protein
VQVQDSVVEICDKSLGNVDADDLVTEPDEACGEHESDVTAAHDRDTPAPRCG